MINERIPSIDEEADRLFELASEGVDLDAPGDPAILRPLALLVEVGLARADRDLAAAA